MKLDLNWEFVADTVMGGVSTGHVTWDDAHQVARLTGEVSLENDGGFVQMAADLSPERGLFDASGFDGIALELRGNGEVYDLRLRTDALSRPWQSFRTEVTAPETWACLHIPFDRFEPHRTDAAFDPARLRRVGILAIGRVFTADVSVRSFGFYAKEG
ncbi:CIA30 family protein [Aestuariivita boseongensis]|uniref:CIA30 family protein n=1 Tax=Aestuariivita boseongensis TaxID=1470562 RepID=UPI000680B15E|nr:CIA30 family protein [Aestuariivita boseongensis]